MLTLNMDVSLVAALVVLVLVSVWLLIRLRRAWWAEVKALKLSAGAAEASFHKRLNEARADFETRSHTVMKTFSDRENSLFKMHRNYVRSAQALMRAAVPAVLHMARLNRNREEFDRSCRWLYLMNSLGLWTPRREEVTWVSRGQVVSRCNPAEVDKLIAQIIEEGASGGPHLYRPEEVPVGQGEAPKTQ